MSTLTIFFFYCLALPPVLNAPQKQRDSIYSQQKKIMDYYYGLDDVERTHKNFILSKVTLGSIALKFGDLNLAYDCFKSAALLSKNISTGRILGTKSILLKNEMGLFKGRSYEKSMMFIYAGLLDLKRGNYNNARIGFSNAILMERLSFDKNYHDDLALPHLMLAKMYQVLKQNGNMSVAISKTNSILGRNAFQEQNITDCNAFFIVQAGLAPYYDDTVRHSPPISLPYPEKHAEISIDGKPFNRMTLVANITHQASTSGISTKSRINRVKRGAEILLKLTVFGYAASMGLDASKWGYEDCRYWATLPDRIFVTPIKLKPGQHKVKIRFKGETKNLLARFNESGFINIDKNKPVNLYIFSSISSNNIMKVPISQNKRISVSKRVSYKNIQVRFLKNCCDSTGHQRGFKPFFRDGNCYCSIRSLAYDDWVEHGFITESRKELISVLTREKYIFPKKNQFRSCGFKNYNVHVFFGGKYYGDFEPGTDMYKYFCNDIRLQ